MKTNIFLLLLIPVAIIVATSILNTQTSTTNIENDYASSMIGYNSMVCVYKNSEQVSCKPNLFTNMGANMTRDKLIGSTSTGFPTIIALANVTSPQGKENNTSPGEWGWVGNKTCGLQNASGTVTMDAGLIAGNWSIANTFTSTCDNAIVNGTALYNSTTESARKLFAQANFTSVTLQTSDQITVTWYIWVTG